MSCGTPRGGVRWRATLGLTLVQLALVPGIAGAAATPPDPGQSTSGTVTSNGTPYNYLLHTPGSYRRGRGAPLLVMVHGCQTTAAEMMKWSNYNPLAEREGFVVLYPDVDALGRAHPGPANRSW